MRSTVGFIVVACSCLAAAACAGQIVPDDNGAPAGPRSTAAGGTSSGGSGESTAPVEDAGAATPVSPPGACGAIPGGTGTFGAPQGLTAIDNLGGIALDAQYAYVASYEVGPLFRVSLADGTTTQLDSLTATNVAINSTKVFTVGYPNPDSTVGVVAACAKTGCGGSYATVASAQPNVWGVAADDAYVYWTNQGGTSPGLLKAPAAGGAPTALAGDVSANTIALGAGRVFYVATAQGNSGNSSLYSVPVGGGAPTEVVPAPEDGSVESIALDCASVYYTLTDGTVGKVPLSGGPGVILATGARQSLQIAVDAQYLYFGTPDGIAYVPVGGGAVTIIPGTGWYTGIAVDANALYWTPTEGGLMRVTK